MLKIISLFAINFQVYPPLYLEIQSNLGFT